MKEPLWTRNFILLCISNFFQFMTNFIMMSTLPIFITNTLHGSRQEVGILVGVYLFSALLCRPLMGRWVDQFDQKKILMMISFAFFIPFCLYYFVTDIRWMFPIRVLHGICFGGISTATLAIVANAVPIDRTGEGIGYFAMSMTLGSVLGPMAGLYLINFIGFGPLFLLCAAFVFLAFLSTCTLKLISVKPKDLTPKQKQPLHWSQFIEKATIPVGMVTACGAFAFSSIATFITLYTDEMGLLMFAAYFFLVSALTILVSRPFVGRAFDRIKNPDRLIYPAILIYSVGILVLSQATSGIAIICSGMLVGLGNGTLFSCLQALAIRLAPKGRKGAATSTFYIFFDIGSGSGALLLGILAASIGYSSMYSFTAIIALSAAGLYYIGSKKVKRAAN